MSAFKRHFRPPSGDLKVTGKERLEKDRKLQTRIGKLQFGIRAARKHKLGKPEHPDSIPKGITLNPLTKKSLSDNFFAAKLEIRLQFTFLRWPGQSGAPIHCKV